MPIYEYRCNACEHEMEAMQKLADPPLADCPECGQPALKKKISAVGFRLKGSGWYETDFKNSDKKKNLAKDDGPPKEDKAKDKPEKKSTETSASKPKDAAAAS